MRKKKSPIKIGQRFEKLTVIEYAGKDKYNNNLWKCKCDCGNFKNVATKDLNAGHIKSCGCGSVATRFKRQEDSYIKNIYNLSSYNYGVGYYKNKQFLFDKEDYDLIKEYIWVIADNDYVKSYYKTDGTKNKKAIRLHVLVMHSDPKKYDVDHIHHNLLDNRKSQLRKVLHCENIMNTKLYSNNTTGVKGVYWDKSRNKWMVAITAYKKTYHIGRFDKFEDAVKARHDAERKYQKDFYNKDLNKGGKQYDNK